MIKWLLTDKELRQIVLTRAWDGRDADPLGEVIAKAQARKLVEMLIESGTSDETGTWCALAVDWQDLRKAVGL